MVFELPALPYDRQALEPHISARTLDYHYGRHHRAHVARLNALVAGTEQADRSLEEIIATASGELFDQAAEVWNHTFFWHCLSPQGGGEPAGALAEAIAARFGSFEGFKEAFGAAAAAHFGSGWTWLVRTAEGDVELLGTRNADTPIAHGQTPLLAVDVWEHAYYLDYQNARPAYLEAIWALVNWAFVAQNFEA
ncbi:Fe-Mn family superoxide dismutase [Halomonas mongoliensis]|jgi:Fe-Mn family superoxide dismutase|uniref:Superoxide dismutase n=1 Tax=Halomonas mongoliensis TaxID=321265 RepID=A0ABU1GKQ1_9GAMM|nr:Fe-Mn family superoxide dismutase [Halomonas mongoliensis]MDR5892589.1 Fe-Mn family superoxide dismutase [Halomonas mongoliensis]